MGKILCNIIFLTDSIWTLITSDYTRKNLSIITIKISILWNVHISLMNAAEVQIHFDVLSVETLLSCQRYLSGFKTY